MAGNPLASLPGLPQRPSLARSSASETRLTQPGIEAARSRKLNSAPTAAFRLIAGDLAEQTSLRRSVPDFSFFHRTQRAKASAVGHWLYGIGPATFRSRHHGKILCSAERSGRPPTPGGRLR